MTQPATAAAEHEAQIIARYRTELLDGTVFRQHAAGERSYIGYRPVTSHLKYADLLGRLAKLAATSAEAAQMVNAIIPRIQLYGCEEEMYASAYEAARDALRSRYTDVVALASPEPPRRHSDAERPYSLWVILNTLLAIRGKREGWCAAAIRRADGIRPPYGFPQDWTQ